MNSNELSQPTAPQEIIEPQGAKQFTAIDTSGAPEHLTAVGTDHEDQTFGPDTPPEIKPAGVAALIPDTIDNIFKYADFSKHNLGKENFRKQPWKFGRNVYEHRMEEKHKNAA